MAKAAKTLPPQDPLTAGRRALHKRRNAAQDRRDALGLLGRVVVLAAAAWVLFTQVFLLTQASGNSMFPAVKDGDLLIGYRLQGTYAKNDVVLYEQDGKLRVGRVLGRENDLIALDDSGTLIVNGSAQSGEILYPTYAKDTLEYPYTVPADSVFILGDYRTQSEDSRDFGPVALTDVKAKVITLLRRRSVEVIENIDIIFRRNPHETQETVCWCRSCGDDRHHVLPRFCCSERYYHGWR